MRSIGSIDGQNGERREGWIKAVRIYGRCERSFLFLSLYRKFTLVLCREPRKAFPREIRQAPENTEKTFVFRWTSALFARLPPSQGSRSLSFYFYVMTALVPFHHGMPFVPLKYTAHLYTGYPDHGRVVRTIPTWTRAHRSRHLKHRLRNF